MTHLPFSTVTQKDKHWKLLLIQKKKGYDDVQILFGLIVLSIRLWKNLTDFIVKYLRKIINSFMTALKMAMEDLL